MQPIYQSSKNLIENPKSTSCEVVLCSPQIPQNTGSIARLCAAFNVILHIIEPMAFQITEKNVRRAGLDYWQYVDLYIHKNWDDFLNSRQNRRLLYIETGTTNDPYDFKFLHGDIFVFGAETFGIPKNILNCAPQEHTLTIPMYEAGVRSINLANTVSMVLYLGLSQVIRIAQ